MKFGNQSRSKESNLKLCLQLSREPTARELIFHYYGNKKNHLMQKQNPNSLTFEKLFEISNVNYL